MTRFPRGAAALVLSLGMATSLSAQSDDFGLHTAAAMAAAGTEHVSLFQTLCPVVASSYNGNPLPTLAAALPTVAGEEKWVAAPVKVFDNLFYVGQTEYSAWAVDTGEGLIVIDALYDYSVEKSVADGLRQLGYDPNDIEYVIVSHGHGDHVGGAAHLQEAYGARIVMSEADWNLVEASTADWPKPRRDIVAQDGDQIKLGEVTVTMYLTPGHTPGTLSTIISPIRDGGDLHVAAAWGGTAFNFRGSAEFPREFWLRSYEESAERFRDVVEAAGADVLIANHPRFDRTPGKIAELAQRRPGQAHPYVIGTSWVQRYLTVADQCAEATRILETR